MPRFPLQNYIELIINFLLIAYSALIDFLLYRYDFRAGFWGVLGGPCLGIIPVSYTILSQPVCCMLRDIT